MKTLKEIVIHYNNRCDNYDDSICTWKNKYWESMPMNGEEMKLVNINAKNQFMIARIEWEKLWFTRWEVLKEIQRTTG